MEDALEEKDGLAWVTGTIRAVMVKRRVTYAGLVARLAALGVDENERNLRNKVARGTFSAVFFVQCLEALGLDSLKLDMHEVMAKPEGEREFADEVPSQPTKTQQERMDATLASIERIVVAQGGPSREEHRRGTRIASGDDES